MSSDYQVNLTNFLLKLVAVTALLVFTLMWLAGASFVESFLTGVAFCVISYVLGDLFLLPRTRNLTAALADSLFIGLVLWAASAVWSWNLRLPVLAVIALLAGIIEYIMHIRMLRTRDVNRADDLSVLS